MLKLYVMGFKHSFIILYFICHIVLSQEQIKISIIIKQDTLYFKGNYNTQIENIFNDKYFTNNLELKLKNNTGKPLFIPIGFSNLLFTYISKEDTVNIEKYKKVYKDETFLSPIINILDNNDSLVHAQGRFVDYRPLFFDYKEPIDAMSECLLLSKKNDITNDSIFVPSYDETQEYLSKNFMTLDPYEEVNLLIQLNLNRYSDSLYLNLEKNKTYTMQMFYFNYEEFKENISPRILDYFEKKGYKMWIGEVQSNTVKLISFDRLKCCK